MPVPATLAGHDWPTARDLNNHAFGTVSELQGRSPWRPAGPTLSRPVGPGSKDVNGGCKLTQRCASRPTSLLQLKLVLCWVITWRNGGNWGSIGKWKSGGNCY